MSVAALADLRKDLKVTLTESSTTLSEVCSLPSEIFVLRYFVLLGWAIWLCEFCVEFLVSKFTLMDVVEEIEVVIKEVYNQSISFLAHRSK